MGITKGESVSVDSVVNSRLMLGLGWDPLRNEAVDFDASCISFDERNRVVDKIFFNCLSNRNKSIVHSGDNLTGKGEGDDEKIYVDLDKMSSNIKNIFFI